MLMQGPPSWAATRYSPACLAQSTAVFASNSLHLIQSSPSHADGDMDKTAERRLYFIAGTRLLALHQLRRATPLVCSGVLRLFLYGRKMPECNSAPSPSSAGRHARRRPSPTTCSSRGDTLSTGRTA